MFEDDCLTTCVREVTDCHIAVQRFLVWPPFKNCAESNRVHHLQPVRQSGKSPPHTCRTRSQQNQQQQRGSSVSGRCKDCWGTHNLHACRPDSSARNNISHKAWNIFRAARNTHICDPMPSDKRMRPFEEPRLVCNLAQ
jgi:hypothetical protein